MNREELKEALAAMGVTHANNASTEKLNELYEASLAAAAAGGTVTTEAEAEAVTAAKEDTPDDEREIAAKVKAGLTRGQAEEVIRSQRAHDRNLAEAAAK